MIWLPWDQWIKSNKYGQINLWITDCYESQYKWNNTMQNKTVCLFHMLLYVIQQCYNEFVLSNIVEISIIFCVECKQGMDR